MFLDQHLSINIPINQSNRGTRLQFFRLTGLSASTSVLFSYNFPLILGIMYRDMVRGMGRDIVSMTFSERNVVPINKIC